jgi:hypothetical protein
VLHSQTLDGETTIHEGIPITTAERTLVDLAGHVSDRQVGRMFREAIRLKTTTARRIAATAARHPSGRGSPFLAQLAARYATLPYTRTRSNPEARALELLHDAGIEPPLVNVRINGEEADLVWRERELIIEIDGPDYHRFRDEDARKQAIWERAGFVVRRVPSDVPYDDPGRLVALATAPG